MNAASASSLSRETIYAEVRLNQQLRRLENESGVGWPLIIAIGASLLFHCSLLVPQVRDLLLSAYSGDPGQTKARQAAFSVEKEMEKPPQLTPEEEEELTRLGIEDGTTKSTMTWIGYKDYQEHLARLSQVEQAAFRESDTGGAPMQAQPEQQPATTAEAPSQPAMAASPAAPTAAAQAAAPPAMNAPPAANPTPAATQTPTETPAKESAQAVAPPPLPTSLALPETPKSPNAAENVPIADEHKIEDHVLPVERVGDDKDAKVPPEPLKPDQVPPPEAKPEENPAEAKTQQPAAPPQPAATTGPPEQAAPNQPQPPAAPPADPSQTQPSSEPGSKPGPKSSGEVSDRESEASSTVDVPPAKWRNGRPLAAKGLNVRTQRPVFDELTEVSTAPANPIIEIEFDREGVPKKCTILQTSGTPLVDQPILDCLYRWRASGSQLAKLPEGKTLKFRIRMLLR